MMIAVAVGLLATGGVLLFIRMVLGPSVADRAVTVDALLILVIGLLAADAAQNGRSFFVDVTLVISLLAFVGTTIVARFIEQRGA